MGEAVAWMTDNALLLGLVVVLAALLVIQYLRSRRIATQATAETESRRGLEQRLEAFESAGDAIVLFGSGDRCVYANPSAAELFEYRSAREMFGRVWRTLLSESGGRTVEREVLPAVRGDGGWIGKLSAQTRSGGTLPLDASVSLVRGGMLWILRPRHRTDDEPDSARYESLVLRAGNPMALLSAERRILEWNPEAERLLNRSRDAVLDTDFLQLFEEGDRERVEEQLETVLETRQRHSFEAVVRDTPEQTLLWTVTHGSGPGRGTVVCLAQDVSGVKRAEQQLSQKENLYKLLANNSSDLVGLHDLEGTFTYASPSCTTLLGYTQDEMTGKDPYTLSHSDDWQGIQTALAAARTGRLNRTSVRLRTNSGEYTWFEVMVRPIYNNLGAVVQLQTSSRDISERKAFEDQLHYQALHEPLTGLPNRALFMDRLRQAISRARRSGGNVAVMFMDLDRFKIINDSMGHEAGDRLIQAVAQRLRLCVREADTVARLGGDEFGILLEFNISEQAAEAVAKRIIEELEPPFTFSGQEMYTSASVGIAFNSPDVETAEDLLRYADVAMYRAKSEGAGNYRFYDPKIDAGATGRLALETDLRQAIEREQLFVVYQPIISLSTGKISGVEALVRWDHPQRGLVRPDDFIPMAEETGLIVPLGYFVMRRSCEALHAFTAALPVERKLAAAVNLSTRQFEQPQLAGEIESILAEMNTDPSTFRLEITESELMRDTGRIRQLRELGVQLAIDDFGTGYSSLAYLKNIEADSLKIDRSFISGLGEHPEDEAIVRTVVTLAESLGLDVTAEGIETEDQLTLLRSIGCESGQGYLFAKPQRAEELVELFEQDPTW